MSADEQHKHYSMVIQWSDEDQAYIVTVPELSGCRTHGAIYEEAVRQGQDAVDSWLDAQSMSGYAPPLPHVYEGAAQENM